MTDLPGNEMMRDFLDQLAFTTNAGKWGICVPMIAVFGDTSCGKSSLLSQLAMIELPSNHSLTTRCPILLQLHRGDTQLARISVQWKNTDEKRVEFIERVATADDWDKIPEFVQEAQAHILQHTQKDVAPDLVMLRISSPTALAASEQQPLTLIDLPGLVQSIGQDDAATLVQDVQQLLMEYLQNPRCVILAVHPANVDFHNSHVMALARQVDPSTCRTLAVISKPDLIDNGAEGDVLELLTGTKLANTMGWHMIKGRGQAALDAHMTIQEGLQDEENFFNTVEPWKSLEDRSLFGTHILRQKLGDVMMRQIKNSLPDILTEIRTKQQNASAKLDAMGRQAPLTTLERRRYYQDICTGFLEQLKASLSGRGGRPKAKDDAKQTPNQNKSTAAAQLHEACANFMDHIREGSMNTVRTVVEGAHVLVTSAKGDVRGEVVHLDEDFACVDFIEESDDHIGTLFEFRGYKAQQDLEVDDVWSDGTQIYIARRDNVFDSLRRIPLDRIRTDPSWLVERIVDNRTDDLACFLNVDIFKNIVEGFVEDDWKPHCITLINQTRNILLESIKDALDSKLPADGVRYPRLRLYLDRQCREVAQAMMLEADKQVTRHLDIEKHPYTQDHVLFDNIAQARHRGLKRELEMALKLDKNEQAVFDTQAIQSIVDDVFERNRKKSVEQSMAQEMEIVLEAYGQISTKRVIDRTPMVCWEVFRSLSSSIQDALWTVTDEALQECMQESPEFSRTYQSISEELDEMNKALEIFESLS